MTFSERLADLEAKHAAATSLTLVVACEKDLEYLNAVSRELPNLLKMAKLAKEMRALFYRMPVGSKEQNEARKEAIASYDALEGE